jgi:hypothetical protein
MAAEGKVRVTAAAIAGLNRAAWLSCHLVFR